MGDTWKRNLPVPFFSQRECKYQWQQINNAGIPIGDKVSLAFGSCNIVSLCMMLHYFGITEDSPDTMMRYFYEKFRPQWLREAYTGSSGTDGQKPGPDRLESGTNMRKFVEWQRGIIPL
jgi:hypothetical protein